MWSDLRQVSEHIHEPSDAFWPTVGAILARFDGLVDGYAASKCSVSTQPRDTTHLNRRE